VGEKRVYRSDQMKAGHINAGNRTFLYGLGLDREELQKPFIGIANTWNEIHPGHKHLREVAAAVKEGVLAAGGQPCVFNTIALCDGITEGHSGMCYVLPSRDLIADSVELNAHAHRFDGLVLIASCDKIVPAMAMAAGRINIPTIIVTGGPMLGGTFEGRRMGGGWMVREAASRVARGELSEEDYVCMQKSVCSGVGSCPMMGTANTMSCLMESLGLALPGCGATHAVMAEKLRQARNSGKRIMELVEQDLKPRDYITWASFLNTLRVSAAIGGSTNTLIHIPAIAKAFGFTLDPEEFNRMGDTTPYLANVIPSGKYTMQEFAEAGGVPAVMKELGKQYLDMSQRAVTGRTWTEELRDHPGSGNREVIASAASPLRPDSGVCVLRGNLAPAGAAIKRTAVHPKMLRHRGPARVFDGEEAAVAAIRSGEIHSGDVVVIRYEGPKGGPGMREMQNPVTAMISYGLSECAALVTDGRFSGASHGPCIGHVVPEAAEGGPIALVREGDMISIDIPGKKLMLEVSDAELEARKKTWVCLPPKAQSHYLNRFRYLVTDAWQGAVMEAPESP
jgi:dihydroxy-acid dehydratase